ncbi:hypothetical protein OG241_49265 [Streptomyces sp. NBC_01390]
MTMVMTAGGNSSPLKRIAYAAETRFDLRGASQAAPAPRMRTRLQW